MGTHLLCKCVDYASKYGIVRLCSCCPHLQPHTFVSTEKAIFLHLQWYLVAKSSNEVSLASFFSV